MKKKHGFRNLSQKDVDTKALYWDTSEIILPELLSSYVNEKWDISNYILILPSNLHHWSLMHIVKQNTINFLFLTL